MSTEIEVNNCKITLTLHPEDNNNQATSPLFPSVVIAKLEKTQGTALQRTEDKTTTNNAMIKQQQNHRIGTDNS